MPINIRVSVADKRSTSSQYENRTLAADIEAQGLELHTPEEIQRKTRELFQLARGAIQAQLLEPLPSAAARTTTPQAGENGDGAFRAGNGRRRSHGRPSPPPSEKQVLLIRRLARERGMDAGAVSALAERICGLPLRSCNKTDVSAVIEELLKEVA